MPAAEPTSRPLTVVVDPGHGGPEVGAAANGVVEEDSNLDMALRVERLLQAEGIRVVIARRGDGRSVLYPQDRALTGFAATRMDLQARVDLANDEEADLFVSIHSNGSSDTSQSGVEVWYDPNRPFGVENAELAALVQGSVLDALNDFGYAGRDRGIKDDSCFRRRNGRCFTLYVLGPERQVARQELLRRGANPEDFGFGPNQEAIVTRATGMPGVLVELLFISNEADAAVLLDNDARDAMARGLADAIVRFLERGREMGLAGTRRPVPGTGGEGT